MTEKNENGIMKKAALADAIGALLSAYSVFAPTGEDERLAFTQMTTDDIGGINLTGMPVLSPKELLLPRSETLFGLEPMTGEIHLPEYTGSTLLFGVRPCDTHSIANLDRAFLGTGKEYRDASYAARREKLTVVALACAKIPYRTCFCDSMGGGPADPMGADVMLRETKAGDAWLAESITEKGRQAVALWQSAGLLTARGRTAVPKPPSCSLEIEKPEGLSKKLISAFEDPAWARFSEPCLGCGICTFICPTCYCFDIDAELTGGKAEEFRCWDCCMFSDYSRMAGGHDPRPTKKERLRNRFLHKLAYFDERYGKTLCVGCGRCIMKCPAGIDIAEVIEWGAAL
ncbi:MAG: 4Fe-4S dicluster domain-containing protein [Clostridiales bacterium]|nr:4Fe-4S dicluster domain-containing protein [Clostridiales bacterium]